MRLSVLGSPWAPGYGYMMYEQLIVHEPLFHFLKESDADSTFSSHLICQSIHPSADCATPTCTRIATRANVYLPARFPQFVPQQTVLLYFCFILMLPPRVDRESERPN